MPVNHLLSDEEILMSFTEEEKYFHDWYTRTEDQISKLMGKFEDGMLAITKFIDAAWPDRDVRARYYEWEEAWIDRQHDRMKRAISQSEFLDTVLATDFRNASSRAQHLWMMEILNTPFCLIGESDFGGVFTGYAFYPGPAYLWPNFENENDVGLLHPNILAINTNVRVEGDYVQRQDYVLPTTQVSPQKRRREADSSGGDTVRSGNSDDADLDGGFIFVQLGALFVYNGTTPWAQIRTSGRKAIISGPNKWDATGFGVVLEIDSQGHPGPVKVIYNFHNLDESDGSDTHRHYHIPMMAAGSSTIFSHIGRLTTACDRTFTVAKIAESLAELKDENAKIDFRVEATVEFQIVRVKACVSTPGMPLVRQFVKAE